MDFTLAINTEGDAFTDAPNVELARILRDLARDIERGDMDVCRADGAWKRPLVDVNGNTVGAARFIPWNEI